MHWYVYEEFLNDKKYAAVLDRIESRLSDLEIKGRVCRLSVLKNLREAVKEAVDQGAETIVAVGSDQIFFKLTAAAAELGVTLGFIPLDNSSLLMKAFGLPLAEKACDVIAQRLVKKIDLGKVNNNYFLDSLSFTGEQVFLEFVGYQISPATSEATLSIKNFGLAALNNSNISLCCPCDGKLEAVIEPLKKTWWGRLKLIGRPSVFPFKKGKIVSVGEPANIIADGQMISRTPGQITIEQEKLKVIVGARRLF